MWSDLGAWFASPAGQRALTDAVLPVAAILVAAVLAALIARGAVRRLERRMERDGLVAAVGGFTEAARRTAAGEPFPGSASRLAAEADVRLRFSGRPGADLAADWAFQVALAARAGDAEVVRDRLLTWTRRPGRARRLFAADLDALRQPEQAAPVLEDPRPEQERGGEHLADRPVVERPVAQRLIVERPTADRPGGERLVMDRPTDEQHPAMAATEHTNQPPRAAEPEVPAMRPAPTGRSTSGQPAWLDDYDDDAHVTRNIPLNTPAPVAASGLRDRGRGDDIVPS